MSSLFCSHHAIVVHFGFEHVLRSKTGWSFSISQLSKVVPAFATIFFRIVLHALMACACSSSQFPEWCKPHVCCNFLLQNVLCATRALFRHLNFNTCSESDFFATFDFPMCFAPHWAAMFHFLFGKPTSQGAFFSNRWSHRTLESIFFAMSVPFPVPAFSFF